MAVKKTLSQQIQEFVSDPELIYLLSESEDFAALLKNIEETYNRLHQEIETIEQTLNYRNRAYNYSQKLLTEQNQEIHYQATHDGLTGLSNRDCLMERIKSSIQQSQRNNTPFALMSADLDNFKSINDRYGHDFGDLVLIEIAKKLNVVIGETDTVARLAGDEFCILLMNIESPSHSARVARAIFKLFRSPLIINEQSIKISLSIGISHFPEDGISTDGLLKSADVAMFEAKKRGTNNLQFYEQHLAEQMTQRIEFEKDLREAIDKNELEIKLQPQLDTHTGNLLGASASLNWQHPIRGQIASSDFYDIATDNRLLIPVFNWLLKKACQEVEHWLDKGNSVVPINIPVYEHQFLHPEFVSNVEKVIAEHPKAIVHIELVISEDVITLDRTLALTQFIKLYRINIATALIQHSNGLLPTGFFQKAKIRTLHLDCQLIHEADSSEMSETLLKDIVSLAQSLNLIIYAPGVNNVQQQINLDRMGCNKISGNFFSKPLDLNDFLKVLNRFKHDEKLDSTRLVNLN